MRQCIFSCFLVISTVVLGQGTLEFNMTTHDFGQIKEVDGAAEYSFAFVNSGDQPLKISLVKASCGCTTPYWSKEEILPGDTGRVSARYNTRNRPGVFSKSLRITSNATNANLTLYIKGNVEPRPRTIEDDFPAKFGALRVKNRSFNIGKITTEQTITRSFDVYNDSDSLLRLFPDSVEVPGHISIAFVPKELQSKERGIINITYDVIKINDLGYRSDDIVIRTNEADDPEKKLAVIATIAEYFPPMSMDDLELAPKMVPRKKTHDFGKIAKDSVVETEFILVNEGKSELNIRMTKANCPCVIPKLEKDTLQPGEKVIMKVTFDTKGRRGRQYKNVSIFSNDPKTPTRMVTVKAVIGAN